VKTEEVVRPRQELLDFDAPEVTVLIPAWNEAESLRELIPAIARVVQRTGRSFEILVVDDGSTDATMEVLRELSLRHSELRALSLRRNFGKSAALATGFLCCRGRYVITMDADLQDDPEEIPGLLQDLEGGLDLVSGWKRKRHDPFTKTWPSRFFNRVTSWISGIRLHDFNCGLKAYRREVCQEIELYGEMHRYIPVLAHREGFRVGEREVHHHPRRYGRSKFGASRFLNGFLDLLEVMFLAGGRRTPLHLFGRWGSVLLAAGAGLNLYMLVVWIHEGHLRVRPLLLFGVILIILGIQFISIGLLAALIHAPASRRRSYPVRDRLPRDPEA
jgi:glycosyltransferase involved in cell wall biosynthesis